MEKIFHTKRNTFSSTDEALQTVFSRFFGIHNAKIMRDKGKPYLQNGEALSLFFSVAHTDNELFIAVSDKNVGIDAEKRTRFVVYEPIIKRFSLAEREEIRNTTDFLFHWTAKESTVKWLGGTLARDLYKLQYVNGQLIHGQVPLPVNLCFLDYQQTILAVCGERDFSKAQILEF